MASEKKPSIYYDRGTIGSSAELDEYGVWVKSEPQDLSGAESQEFPESPSSYTDPLDSDFDSGLTDPGFDAALDSDDLSSLPDLDIPDKNDSSGLDDLGLPEPDDSVDFSGGIAEEPIEEAGPDDDEGFTEISMDDFLDPAEPEPVAETLPAAGREKTAAGDLSTQLLMKIADELSSIRTELTTLKKEFAAVRGEAPAEERGDSQSRGGFFDEEDDEKIALTGDELDNILNTADFTEETGADATGELKEDLVETGDSGFPDEMDDKPLPDMLSDEEDIIGEDITGEGTESAESGSETISGEAENIGLNFDFADSDLDELGSEAKVEDQISGFSLDDIDGNDELKQLQEEGVKPMTPPPEDTTYLEEDPLAVEKSETAEDLSLEDTPDEFALDSLSLDEGSMDLSEAVIDEPDLGAGITENPLQEPLLDDFSLDDDISIDMDLSGLDEKNPETEENIFDEDSGGDIAIDIPGEEEETTIDIPAEEEIAIDIPGEDIDIPDDDAAINISGEDTVTDAPAGDITETVSFEDTPELPSVKSTEDDSFAPVIPEGFIVEADDSSVPFEDDIEEKEVLADDGLAALDETAEISSGAEAVDAETAGVEEPELPVSGTGDDFDDEALDIPSNIKQELKTVLSYMDQLLESLPDEKIEEFAKSEYFDTYKKLFKELGLV
ncbi:MAG: hypothetical protein LBG42_09390 [Treponema sp.]|jgi:hypothetical protein|nr:hypothetical protein [Treponema sp.]